MELITLFMTLCLNTGLPCDDIKVSYGSTPKNAEGVAELYSSGRMEIRLRPSIKLKSSQIKPALLHEISHLVTFQDLLLKGKTVNGDHNKRWLTHCKKLALDNDVAPRFACRNEKPAF